jgi:trk system potassium uptake protein TrkH
VLPIIFFAVVILGGTIALHHPVSYNGQPLNWIDALFTATSATCVTGLIVVDTGSFFSRFGQSVILFLIQVGGLGIMTFASLFFYLWRQRVSLTDRMAVGKSLLHDPTFHLGKFLVRIVIWTIIIEAVGGLLILLLSGGEFSLYSSIFHAVSAFCNAGFSLYADSLMRWQGNPGINLIFIALIVLGGVGFSVLVELQIFAAERLKFQGSSMTRGLSWYAKVILQTTLFLIVSGWIVIYFTEYIGGHNALELNSKAFLGTLFQSVTCRTAGFNTMDIGQMTNVSLLFMVVLMFIGGAPGSCAGGVKVTTFRVIASFIRAQFKGREQVVVGTKFAIRQEALNKAVILMIFAVTIVFVASLLLNITEGWGLSHQETRGLYFEVLFEAVSAFGTVGLSTGLTPKLSIAGKWIIIILMFVGRLGPIVFMAAIQSYRKKELYSWPEEDMLIG